MSFETIIGNENIKELLNKTVKSNNILHSYLFSGIDGIGKRLFALEFSKMILCQNEYSKPCNKCTSCIEFENNNNPDFMLIETQDKSIKIEQIRYMNSKIYEKPIISDKKIVIIDNSDTMTKEAQNSLLKTLEEPPEYACIILITSNESKLLNTIKSRCVKVNFNKISEKQIEEFVKLKTDYDINYSMISYCERKYWKIIKTQRK